MTVIDTEKDLHYFSELSATEQDLFRASAMVFYPDIFGANSSKFIPLVKYLLEDFKCVCPSIRDIFSASGKHTITLADGKEYVVRAVDAKLFALAKNIEQIINASEEAKLRHAWSVKSIEDDRITQFSKVLNSSTEQINNSILVGDAFLSGL